MNIGTIIKSVCGIAIIGTVVIIAVAPDSKFTTTIIDKGVDVICNISSAYHRATTRYRERY